MVNCCLWVGVVIVTEQKTYVHLCYYLFSLQQLNYPSTPLMICIFVFYRVSSIWENSLQITTISSCMGAWLGAFPIPLDWERPWQVGLSYLKWQCTCLHSDSKAFCVWLFSLTCSVVFEASSLGLVPLPQHLGGLVSTTCIIFPTCIQE